MIYLNKIFKIPGPKDLGMSRANYAMASVYFTSGDELTWEDYYAKVKKDYPIKYFISATLIGFFVRIYRCNLRRVTDAFYWFKCNYIKKHKYHLLDLRQPKKITFTKSNGVVKTKLNPEHYSYGWRDIDDRMIFAIFGLLNEYVKHELNVITDEDVKADPNLITFKDNQDEILAIHNWWNNERPQAMDEIDRASSKWGKLSNLKRAEAKTRAWTDLINKETQFEAKTDEMIARLMKIRRTLWS
jgi:hypothetical protein